MKRGWLTYTESANALFCIPCILYSCDLKRLSQSTLCCEHGYKICDVKWRRIYGKFPRHENNKANNKARRDCYKKWKNLWCSVMAAKGIDHHLQRQVQSEVQRNGAILQRLPGVILHSHIEKFTFKR